MSEQDEKELDNYLAGGSALSEQYRRARGDGPPESLDRAVLDQARQALAADRRSGGQWSRRPGWLVPVSTAAVVVLAAALVLDVSLAPQSGVPFVTPDTTERAAPAERVNDTLLDVSQDDAMLEARRKTLRLVGQEERDSARGAPPEPEPILSIATESATGSTSMAKSSDMQRVQSVPSPRIPASLPAAPEPGSDFAGRLETGSPAPSAPIPATRGMAAPEAEFEEAQRVHADADRSDERVLAADSATGERTALQRPVQQRYFQQIERLLLEQRRSEAQDLLDEMIRRWPDLELPAGFPLDDPRTQDPPAAPPN